MLNSKEMARIAYDALDEKLGKDIRIIKIDEISVIADYLIIANGNNSPQIKENLLFYDLERIWRDGRTVEREELD